MMVVFSSCVQHPKYFLYYYFIYISYYYLYIYVISIVTINMYCLNLLNKLLYATMVYNNL